MTSRQIPCTLVVLGLAPALAACNTATGIGQDLQAAGRAITGSSERATQGNASPTRTPALPKSLSGGGELQATFSARPRPPRRIAGALCPGPAPARGGGRGGVAAPGLSGGRPEA
jgi:predicted small secreted protein